MKQAAPFETPAWLLPPDDPPVLAPPVVSPPPSRSVSPSPKAAERKPPYAAEMPRPRTPEPGAPAKGGPARVARMPQALSEKAGPRPRHGVRRFVAALGTGAGSTGMTLFLVVLLAAGASVAPLPDALRPMPTLVGDPVGTLVAVIAPGRVATQESVEPLEVVAAAVGQDDAEPQNAYRGGAADVSPLATLGTSQVEIVRRIEEVRARAGARHVDIEEGCRQLRDGHCTRSALAPFFSALEGLDSGRRGSPVRVVHLGDSLIAADQITEVVRERLALRHGSGGTGFLFVDRHTRFSLRRTRASTVSKGWNITRLTDRSTGIIGLSGVRYSSSEAPDYARFAVGSARQAELFFLAQPRGGIMEVRADTTVLSRILTRSAQPEMAVASLDIPKGTEELAVSSANGEVSLFGVSLENDAPGIVYDSFGLVGATAEVFLRADERSFAAQLRQLQPSLVVLMLGGNEAFEMGRGRMTLKQARSSTESLIRRVRTALPAAACLVTSPLEAGVRTLSGEVRAREHLADIRSMVREVGLSSGCAFWDMYAAMGGEGSVKRWLSSGLLHEDLVHPRELGADLLGHLFDLALERSRLAHAPSSARRLAADPPGLADASGKALARTFEKLARLEDGTRKEPVRFVQLGASHTAGHMFTDVMRERLTARLGKAGRGFVAAGRRSQLLHPGGVRRELEGEWRIADAREGGPGEAWGLTGIRAEGQVGAKLTMRFGVETDAGNRPGTLSLYYLHDPNMGPLEVRIDANLLAMLTAGPTDAREVRVVSWPVKGEGHVLEVRNLGPGLATLFGAALDLEGPGLIYDALGLPGSTSILADQYDKTVFADQLRARRPDLYVLFWGTNESAMASLTVEELRKHYLSLLDTLRGAAPDADCLVLGPTDAMVRRADRSWVEVPKIDMVSATLRQVAAERGCAFWSPRAAMGGPRSILRWQKLEPPLATSDGVHLTRQGYEMLATSLADALLSKWSAATAARQ